MEDNFSYIDIFFAKALVKKKDEDILYALQALFLISRLGHLCLKVDFEKKEVFPDLFFDKKKLLEGLKKLPENLVGKFLEEFSKKPICFDNKSFYLQRNFFYEALIAENLLKILQRKKNILNDFFLKEIEKLSFIKNVDKKILEDLFKNPFSVIFGGPGTGKTYLASWFIYLFLSLYPTSQVISAAPTGKAARNLNEKILENLQEDQKNRVFSFTLHALLKNYKNKKGFFENNYQPKIKADLLVVDEASMMDAKMMSSLFSIIGPCTKVIFIGDPDQLPSIESGNLFSFFKNPPFPYYTLKKEKRFLNKNISNLAQAIKKEKFLKEDIFVEMKENTMEKIFEYVDKFYKKPSFLSPNKAYHHFSSFRILCSMRKGLLGSENLNKKIFEYLKYKKSAPIMITKNDYKLGVYNGSFGILYEGHVYLEGRKIPLFLIPSFEYAYCTSVHKSQGSEYDNVLLILSEGSEIFTKELLYTAVTRAKKNIEIYSSKETFKKIVKRSFSMENNLLERISRF